MTSHRLVGSPQAFDLTNSGTSLVHWQLLHVAAYFGHTEAVEVRSEGGG